MTFSKLGLSEPLLRSIAAKGYVTPTPIQQQAIPIVMQGRDLLATAETGTGKTAGFVLPLLHLLSKQPTAKANRASTLVLVPTRELAAQIHQSVRDYGQHLPLRSAAVFGGVKISPQMKKLRAGVELLVATPGRLLDLYSQRAVRFDDLTTLVLDEADRMLDMGFIDDIKRIISFLPHKRQTLLFSATFSKEVGQLAKDFLRNPQEINVVSQNKASGLISQKIHPVDKNRKTELLSHLIRLESWNQALIFSRTKQGANQLVKKLALDGIDATAIHGNKSQFQRTKALTDFKKGQVRILVATDIAARGLDIVELPMVVNFDLPNSAEDYVHRIGRTGRAGVAGQAISLVSADEARQLDGIEKLIKQRLQRVEIDDFTPIHILPTTIASKHKPKFKSKFKPKSRTPRDFGGKARNKPPVQGRKKTDRRGDRSC